MISQSEGSFGWRFWTVWILSMIGLPIALHVVHPWWLAWLVGLGWLLIINGAAIAAQQLQIRRRIPPPA